MIIPKGQRQDLKELHAGDFGLTKYLHMVKQTIYWPVLYHEINKPVTICQTCLNFNSNHKQQPSQHLGQKVPLMPWSKHTTDLYYLKVLYYRIIVIFLQWQAFTTYRSASSGAVENVLIINITIEILFFIIFFILMLNKKYWF